MKKSINSIFFVVLSAVFIASCGINQPSKNLPGSFVDNGLPVGVVKQENITVNLGISEHRLKKDPGYSGGYTISKLAEFTAYSFKDPFKLMNCEVIISNENFEKELDMKSFLEGVKRGMKIYFQGIRVWEEKYLINPTNILINGIPALFVSISSRVNKNWWVQTSFVGLKYKGKIIFFAFYNNLNAKKITHTKELLNLVLPGIKLE